MQSLCFGRGFFATLHRENEQKQQTDFVQFADFSVLAR
jgi:hypothetical protein